MILFIHNFKKIKLWINVKHVTKKLLMKVKGFLKDFVLISAMKNFLNGIEILIVNVLYVIKRCIYRLKRVQNGITCSKECASILQSKWMKGEGNHQFGLTGNKNASFKGNEIVSEFGYILEYCPEHPFPHDKTNKCCRVFQHRLVVERNADKFDDKYFIEINGNKYLKPEYSVHHINEIKTDNKLENLIILTRSEHSKIHNLEKEIIRNELGRIVGVKKLSKVGEICNDNPEVSSEITKGSETL